MATTCFAPGREPANSDRPRGQTDTAVFRDEATHQELQIAVDAATGLLTATLSSPSMEAFGQVPAVCVRLSPRSAMVAATATISGYDYEADSFHPLEVTISAAWTIDRLDTNAVEVAGTALVTDPAGQSFAVLRAVRCHPSNKMLR